MGQLGRPGEEDVLHHEVIEAGQQSNRAVLVGLRLGRILADGVDGAYLAVLHPLEHLRSGSGRTWARAVTPQAFSNLARTAGSVVQSWNPTRRLGIAPMSPPPWTLFCPRSGLTPGAVLADMPGEQRQIDQREDVVHRVVVLGDAEGPADLGPVGPRVGVSRLPDDFRRDAGLPLRQLEGVGLDAGPIRLEAGRGVPDERLVGQPAVDDLPGHRIGERDIRSRR